MISHTRCKSVDASRASGSDSRSTSGSKEASILRFRGGSRSKHSADLSIGNQFSALRTAALLLAVMSFEVGP